MKKVVLFISIICFAAFITLTIFASNHSLESDSSSDVSVTTDASILPSGNKTERSEDNPFSGNGMCGSEAGSLNDCPLDKTDFGVEVTDSNLSLTNAESFEAIIKDPTKGISDEEAVEIALNHAIELYGEKITSFELIDTFGDDYQVTIIFGEPYKADDFTVYGARCIARVMRDGTVDYCICGDSVPVDKEKLTGISSSDIDSFIDNMIESQFGSIVEKYEIKSFRVKKSENGEAILQIEIEIRFSEQPDPSLTEGFIAAQSLEPIYAGFYQYPID